VIAVVSQQRPRDADLRAPTRVFFRNGLPSNDFDGDNKVKFRQVGGPKIAAPSLKKNPGIPKSKPNFQLRKLTTDAQRIAARHSTPEPSHRS
jgi:hypothetical protein